VPDRPSDPRVVAAMGGLALALRAPRIWARWDEITLAYAAYPEPTLSALRSGDLGGALTQWMGLHPPLWPLVHAVTELVAPSPLVWMGLSVGASVAAVALVTRAGGWAAGLALAVGPLQLAYAAEVNNYPLAVAMVALSLAAARGPWGLLAAAAVLAGWTHLLAGAAAGGVVLWRASRVERGTAARLLAATTLGLLPIAAGALRRMGESGTFTQPDLPLDGWLAMVWGAAGGPGLALAGVGLAGLVWRRRDPVAASALAALGPLGLALVAALLSGAAAPHQRPYLLLLAPPLALGVGQVARLGRLAGGGVALLCAGLAVVAATDNLRLHIDLRAQQSAPRAIDRALEGSAPGDVLWLVSPALQADDDKTATSAVLWRLGPAAWLPIAQPVDFEYRDWRYGQPRAWRGRTVHTSTELYAGPFDHAVGPAVAAGRRVWVVLYDHGPATGLDARVARLLRPYAVTEQRLPTEHGLGDDHLFVVSGLRGAAP